MSASCGGSSTSELVGWLKAYKAVWDCDFEFVEDANHHPVPVCMYAHELHTGAEIELWGDALQALRQAPFDVSPDSLFVAYAANAELSCFLALGWPFPKNVLDVYVEAVAAINGNDVLWMEDKRPKLPEALQLFGLNPIMDVKDKKRMIDVILDNFPNYTSEQRREIQAYNRIDVVETDQLLRVLAPSIDLPYALVRGRYMAAVARMERVGLPIDRAYLDLLLERWEELKLHYIHRDDIFGLYDGTSFSETRFEALIAERGWDWPLTKTGRPQTNLKAFGKQAKRYPELRPLVRLRDQIAELRINQLATTVGADNFSRCPLLPFWTKTGRNQPSGRDKMFLPGLPAWLHGLIAPPPGWSIAELDWDGQEVGLMAGYSGDPGMIEDYASGDPHIGFGRRAKLVPPDATKDTSPEIRQIRDKACKPVVLGQNYGMTPYGIAAKTGKSLLWAREIHALHRLSYPVFHHWASDIVAQAKFDTVIESPFGWRQAVTANTTNRSLMNFPAQAGGADMMRLAAIAATEAGIAVCAPVHDAFWVMAPTTQIDDAIATTKRIMTRAGELVTGGLTIGVSVEAVVHSPQCLGDVRKPKDKGHAIWAEIKALVTGGLRATGS
jgi:DNA polymerase I